MPSNFRQAIDFIRNASNNTTEMGVSFEKLVKVFLENDSTQSQQYEKVWIYSDWAAERGSYKGNDIGVDLVAKIRDQDTYCAIQCKCYGAENEISKKDLDSFVSASASKEFSRLLLIDTSSVGIAPNAQQVLDNLDKEYLRIQSTELEDSRIDWLTLVREDRLRLRNKHQPLPHQMEALQKAEEGFSAHNRGKIIMACGTGKTYTSLIIAEKLAGPGQTVLYMVPSLSLMSQTIREWKNDAQSDFTAFSACSDKKVGNRKKDDEVIVSLHDLAFPATTDARSLAKAVGSSSKDKMTVVFSTYHSIDVITEAQKQHGLRSFDLIICDEAHRTTGATLVGDDESNFVKVHSNDNIEATKRLYMTATPRVYGEKAKSKADDGDVTLASMDDEATYGPLFYYRGFGWAVENNLLTDYKVVVLAVDEGIVSERVQNRLAEGAELKLDDATKIIGCYKALAKNGFKESDALDFSYNAPMRRALAFCQSIKISQLFEKEFVQVVDEYLVKETEIESEPFKVELKHVDGSFDADLRNERLSWLKDNSADNTCRVLTNVRCLSEGVDVPALDAVIFLHPRKSQIDVIQSVGRVMRRAPNKNIGYVIIPITVAPGVSPEKALNDNEKYRVVWQILNALRSHDERFDSTVNKLGLGEDVSDKIEIVGVGAREELDATTAVVDDIKPKKKSEAGAEDSNEATADEGTEDEAEEEQLAFVLSDLSKAIKAKIVERCGTRDYWETWAKDIAKIAQAYITRIRSIVFNSGTPERKVFEEFVAELRDDLNPSITEDQAVEMLAQHLVTKPVFEALFKDHKFTDKNPVSKSLQSIIATLSAHSLEKESDSLQKFYDSVKRRASDIETTKGRQTLILELYERFFSYAFKTTTERLGIVYTPVEVVDFIIRSVEDVLNDEFGISITGKNVQVLDPFAGTGTFITRLLQSGLVKPEDLKRKFDSEIHANEIVLLAYYIATINAESVYQDLSQDRVYRPFDGIVLTDTFQLYEEDKDLIANLLPDNSERRKRQRSRKINVIVGNPPYSSGQNSANDNAANLKYTNLDSRIEKTYAAYSSATNKNSIYDSYIRAFRLASDRIGEEGVIGFVTGAGWIDGNATDGMRRCLVEEFDRIYVFNLRGNQRTAGETSRREGGKIFGSGSRSPIAITVLLRKKGSFPRNGEIFYCDIGDYFDRDEKLTIIKLYGSIKGIANENKWKILKPDSNNDWINQGEKEFDSFIPLGDVKSQATKAVFTNYSSGVKTNRDAWCFNFSNEKLTQNMRSMIEYYNSEVEKFKALEKPIRIEDFVSGDTKKISWNRSLRNDVERGKAHHPRPEASRVSLYRPFTKTFLYYGRDMNNDVSQIPRIFPERDTDNRVIIVSGVGTNKPFSCLMADVTPEFLTVFNGQAFPRYVVGAQPKSGDLFDTGSHETALKKPAISAAAMSEFRRVYSGKSVAEDDIFYFVYGVLHSTDYRAQFENNLSKNLARVPMVKTFEAFKAFSDAGRRLGDLHVNFETVELFPVTFKQGDLRLTQISDPKSFYRVEKMKFAGARGKIDKTTVTYNHNITITNVPLEAYEYVVNGKPALEWVMERQSVRTDKASGIVNDANDYANETMNNPAYPLELFQRVITVSLETQKIVKGLPPLVF